MPRQTMLLSDGPCGCFQWHSSPTALQYLFSGILSTPWPNKDKGHHILYSMVFVQTAAFPKFYCQGIDASAQVWWGTLKSTRPALSHHQIQKQLRGGFSSVAQSPPDSHPIDQDHF